MQVKLNKIKISYRAIKLIVIIGEALFKSELGPKMHHEK